MKKFLVLFLVVVSAAVGWYFYCVNPAMNDFQAAVDSGKPEAIAPFLDVPELKKNVAKYVKARYDRADNPSANMSPEQVQSIVDTFVTPANVLLMMQGVLVEPGSAPPTDTSGAKPLPMEKHYDSPDYYAIDIYKSSVKTPDNMVTLLFERDGWFGWKLAAFRFSWS